MVQWRVGDSVDYEVNGTWYPGYIARSDSSTLYFKYEASKFKSYEEPIKKADRDDLARLRAGSGSGPPAAAKKKKPAAKKSHELGVRGAKVIAAMVSTGPRRRPAKKPAARKPAAKSPAKKKTVAKPAARKPAAKPAAKKPAAKPAAKKSCEPASTAAPPPRRHAKPRRRPAKKKPASKAKSPAKKKSPARKKKK